MKEVREEEEEDFAPSNCLATQVLNKRTVDNGSEKYIPPVFSPISRAIVSVGASYVESMSTLTPARAFLGISSPATPLRTSNSKPVTEAARIIASSLSVRVGILRTKTFSNCGEQCYQ